MNAIQQMIESHPVAQRDNRAALLACIDACFTCAQICTVCADACLREEMVAELRRCIRTDLDCADICLTTGRIAARQTETDWSLLRSQLEACATACQICAAECARHADMHEHCRICADTCRRCEEACRQLIQALPESETALASHRG